VYHTKRYPQDQGGAKQAPKTAALLSVHLAWKDRTAAFDAHVEIERRGTVTEAYLDRRRKLTRVRLDRAGARGSINRRATGCHPSA
jgi:hypothetical protein